MGLRSRSRRFISQSRTSEEFLSLCQRLRQSGCGCRYGLSGLDNNLHLPNEVTKVRDDGVPSTVTLDQLTGELGKFPSEFCDLRMRAFGVPLFRPCLRAVFSVQSKRRLFVFVTPGVPGLGVRWRRLRSDGFPCNDMEHSHDTYTDKQRHRTWRSG